MCMLKLFFFLLQDTVIVVNCQFFREKVFFSHPSRERRTCGTAVVIISLVQLLKAKYGFDLGLPEFKNSEAQH